ncbi:MAG: class I SAM-dependent methyltransferase [Rubrivivax sp.]
MPCGNATACPAGEGLQHDVWFVIKTPHARNLQLACVLCTRRTMIGQVQINWSIFPMFAPFKHNFRRTFPNLFLRPEGEEGIRMAGHRLYVGGAWDEIGTLQFEFLKQQGLKPDSYLLDIACGALRLGVHAIPYLDRGHYFGIEKEKTLLDVGVQEELGTERYITHQPQLIVSSSFEFQRFTVRPDFAIAQSLFTHLTPEMIDLCFNNLRSMMKANTVFFATYFRKKGNFKNPSTSHDHGFFAYTQEEMLAFGTRAGFKARYIGDWKHPRKQVMVEYRI